MLWIVFALLCSVAEQQIVGSEGFTTLNTVMHPSIFGFVTGYTFLEWGNALLNLMTLWFNGTVWQGDWIWFYWIVCVPVVVGFVWEMVQFAIWGIGNIGQALRGIFGFFR